MLISDSVFNNVQNQEPQRLNEKAYHLIKQNIIKGVIRPGTFFAEKDLIAELGISRTPVREALQKLETENFIQIYPKRGIFVPEISLKDIKDIYSIREVLEPFAAKLATNNVSTEEIEKFRKAFISEPKSMDAREFIDLDHEFHKMIFLHSDNFYLINMLLRFNEHQYRIRNSIAEKIYDQKELVYKEHLEILKALQQQNPKEVERTMKIHISNGIKRMMKQFHNL